jgi:hypothetical protein
MKISSEHSAADAKEKRRQGELGFTMIEIAMAIGVIGFALVAIIGILPAGMSVQQSNREDTLVSQDAPYFLDAIRNGCVLNTNRFGDGNQNLDFLTNYVESITFTTNSYSPSKGLKTVAGFTYSNFTSGSNIIGLLSTPEWIGADYSFYLTTSAIVRGLSGPAVQQNGGSLATAFRYQMTVEIAPFMNIAPDSTNYVYYANLPNPDSNQVTLRYNRWLETTPGANNGRLGTGALVYNLFDIRLHFSWPVLPNGVVGPNHQTYRGLIAAQLLPTFLANGDLVYFFQPLSYTNSLPAYFNL